MKNVFWIIFILLIMVCDQSIGNETIDNKSMVNKSISSESIEEKETKNESIKMEIINVDTNKDEKRRLLPSNLLHQLNLKNLLRFLKFVFDNFQEWAKNKAITFVFQLISSNLVAS